MSRLGIWFLIACGAVTSSPQARKSTSVVNLRYEEPVRNGLYPELLYWFVTPETLAPERYTHDVQHIAHDTEFDFPFLTAREGVNFTGNKPAHDAVAGIVKEAHENGLRIGVSLGLGDGSAAKSASPDEQQTVVADGEGVLDAQGVGNFEASIKLRSLIPQKTELLRAWAFRKAGPGEYDTDTLVDVTSQVTSSSPQPGTLSVAVKLGPQFAGYTVFALAENWYGAVDLFNPAFAHWIHSVIDEYRDIPLDGTALDEFGYIRIPWSPKLPGAATSPGMPLPRASNKPRECRSSKRSLPFGMHRPAIPKSAFVPSTNTGISSAKARSAWRMNSFNIRGRYSETKTSPGFTTPITII